MSEVEPPLPKPDNPYVGPRPFEKHEQRLFFGRDWEAEELVALIIAHPVVLLYAESGAGKSSLLNARILPKLQDEETCEVLPVARVRGDIPEGIHAGQIANLYAFNTLLKWTEDGAVTPAQLAQLSLAGFLKSLPHQSDREGDPALRVIIFDQFEELFTFYPERWKEREKFFIQVNEALAADSLLRVLFVIREDYLAQLDPYEQLLPEQLRYRFRLERLRREAALAAVTGPLQGTGRSFASGVAESLVDELLKIRVEDPFGKIIEAPGEFVEPVQLQVVCQSLWAELPPAVTEITYSQLQAFGNIDQALTEFYQKAVQNTIRQIKPVSTTARLVPVYAEWELRNWFERKLVTPAGTRGLVYRGIRTTAGIPNAAVDLLEGQHLIRGEQRAGGRWYELTHDRLIGPIQRSNVAWRSLMLKQGGVALAGLAAIIYLVLISVTAGLRSFDELRLRVAEATARAAENEVAQIKSEATADIAQVTVAAASTQQSAYATAAATAANLSSINPEVLPAEASTAIAATQVAATVIAATQEAAKVEAILAAAEALLAGVDATATAIAVEAPAPSTATAVAAMQQAAQATVTAIAQDAVATRVALEAKATAAAETALAATQAAQNATATAATLLTQTPIPTATATPTATTSPISEPTVTPTPTPRPAASWPPPGWIVFTSARLSPADLYLMSADGSAINDDGSNVRRLTQDIAFDPGYARGNNQIVFASVRDKRAALFVINPQGREERNVGGFEWDNWEPTFAPNGRQVAFVSSRDGEADIYSIQVGLSAFQRLTDDPAKDYAPAWSPDGQRIAFVSDRTGQADIWVMDTDGRNLVRLTDNPAQDVNPAWSPDSAQITFASTRDGNADIFVMNADGSHPRNLTRSPFEENYPAWSFDGAWLAFSRFTVNNEIFIMTVNGQCPAGLPKGEVVETTQDGNCLVNITKSSDADWSPVWLPRSAFTP